MKRLLFGIGMLAMVAFFAAFVVSTVAKPIDEAFGRTGLLTAAFVAALATVWLFRRVQRWQPGQ